MHLADSGVPEDYSRHTTRRFLFILAGLTMLIGMLAVAISLGAVNIPVGKVIGSLLGTIKSSRINSIVWEIRLPQAATAIVAGAGLASSGAVIQAILRNPLGSPFTLGVSHAAAFGAALSVMIIGSGTMQSTGNNAVVITNPLTTTMWAFIFSLGAAFVVMAISRLRNAAPEVMILSGVALGALCTAGTMFLQYFADDVQLAAMVFWTFGDTSRTSWSELGIIAAVTVSCITYFIIKRWDYNALAAGDDTAASLGVHVERTRLFGMLAACLCTAVIVSFIGIIGFVGLVCPHMVRLIVGDDQRFLLPASAVAGALLLLASDTVARLVLAPHVLPVSVLTAFLGAPAFLYLIIRGYGR